MKCTTEEMGSCIVLRIEGSMSDDYLREIRLSFDEAINRDLSIIVDLSEVSYISSSGLGMLFNSDARLKNKNRKLVVTGIKEDIRRLFSVTRIENHIMLADSLNEALQIIG
jgi:anti-sigma B factor antagonist